MAKTEISVGIVLGSDSDWETVEPGAALLQQWDIGVEVTVASAHRSPRRVEAYAREAEGRGLKVIIAAAGAAAHLAGVIASHTILPVIGVPIPNSALKGLDSLLAMVQMPAGVPVATMALGSAGAKNAAILAAQVLALSDARVADILRRHKQELAGSVVQQNEKIPPEYRK